MDTAGKKYSKKPLPKARAERQLKALHIHTGHGLYGGDLMQTLREIAQQGFEAFRDFLFRNPDLVATIFGVITVTVHQMRQLYNSMKEKGDGLQGSGIVYSGLAAMGLVEPALTEAQIAQLQTAVANELFNFIRAGNELTVESMKAILYLCIDEAGIHNDISVEEEDTIMYEALRRAEERVRVIQQQQAEEFHRQNQEQIRLQAQELQGQKVHVNAQKSQQKAQQKAQRIQQQHGKSGRGLRGGQLDSQFSPNDINNVKLFLRGEAMWTLLPQIVRSYLGRVSVDTLTVPLGKLVRDSKNQGSTDSEADQELANEVVNNPAFAPFISAVRADLTMAGQGLRGGRLSETWPMLKDHLDQVTTRIEFQQLPIGEKKPYLEEQMKAVILEMIHLLDEFHEKKDLITRGTTYIGKILSGTFTPDVEQQQKIKEGLVEVARKPVGHIVGNISASDTTPFFKKLHPSEYPSLSENTYNPIDTRHYYNPQPLENPRYPTEVDPELPPHSLSQTLQTLSGINQRTGEYYDELVKQGIPAMTPAEVKARDAKQKKGQGLTEPDHHILIGDYLSGSGSGKWTALISALGRMYNIPQKVVDATIAINDKQTGPLRFSAKRNNVLHQFRDFLDPTVVSEINDLEEGTVAEYAKTIDGRRSILNLRSVQTTNPLALHGQGLRGGIAVKLIKNADRTYSVAKVSGEILETVGTKREAELALTKWYKYQPPPPEPVVHKPVATKGGPINWGEGKYKFVKKYLKGQGIPATKKNVAKICNIMDVEGVVFE